MKHAVVCVGEAGINGLATVRALGRRGVPVHVVALAASPQIASSSRYCASFTPAPDLASLAGVLRRFDARPLLYVDNDAMLKALAPHAGALAQRFAMADEIAQAPRLTDKAFQMDLARQAGIAVPQSWFPADWNQLDAIRSAKRLIAKPLGAADFKALVAPSAEALAGKLREHGASPAQVLVQEFIEGDDAQIYVGLCYRARSREQCFVLSARKLRQSRPGSGVMAAGQVVDAPHVREMTRRLARMAGARGTLCTEFKRDARDGRWYFIEWNPRPAYFQSIGWKAGFDLAWLAYCDHADPARLREAQTFFAGAHYWVNLHADLRHIAKRPRLVLDPGAWRPYLGRTQWAVFALDDPRPWARAMRQLAAWIGELTIGRWMARSTSPRISGA